MAFGRSTLIGVALLFGGIGSAIYGYAQYRFATNPTGVALRQVFDPPTPELSQAAAIIIAGLAVATVGVILLLRR